MKWIVVVALILSLWSGNAAAQTSCDRFNAATIFGTDPTGTERVAGVMGKRVYLCGYVVVPDGGASLEFELFSGTGDRCSEDRTLILPRMPIPLAGIVNRIPIAAGEYTPVGHSLCSRTYGNGTLSTIFYWAQF